jgi:ribonuclease E
VAGEREDQPEAQAAEQDTAERAALKRSDVTEVHASPEAPEPAPAEPAAPAPEERVEAEPPVAETAAEEPVAAGPSAAEAAPPQPAAAPPGEGEGGTSPAAADRRAAEDEDPFSEHPELYVAAAFVAALVLGKLLKRLTRGKGD